VTALRISVITYADGYGLWHAIVRGVRSEKVAAMAAHEAIALEIRDRHQGDILHGIALTDQTSETFHYQETDQ
jgi:hypothetical protein